MKTIAGRLIKIVLIVILILTLGAGCAPGGRYGGFTTFVEA
jgi:hypothetical protein